MGRPRGQARPTPGHLRRARWRSRFDRVLRHGRARLRELLAVPGADRAPGGSAVRARSAPDRGPGARAAYQLADAVVVVPSATVSVAPGASPGAKRCSTV